NLLPERIGGCRLRHVLEVTHASFQEPEFAALVRARNIAVAMVDSEEHPSFEEVTSDFVYARLRRCVDMEPMGYSGDALDGWAARFRALARPAAAAGLPKGQAAATS